MAARRVGGIYIPVTAGTAELALALEKNKTKIREFGSHTVSQVQATSGAIRTAMGGSNLRVVEQFLAKTLNLGPALQAAFPLIGGLAFGGMIVDLGEKVVDFYRKMQDSPARIAEAFRGLAASTHLSNDQLAVTKANLENTIARLEGRPQNGMKVAILEAVDAADQLADSLDRDIKKIGEVLVKEKVSMLARAGGATSSNEILDVFGGTEGHRNGIQEQLAAIDRVERQQLLSAQKISDKKMALAATEAAEQKANDDRKSAIAIANGRLDSIATREALKQAAAQKEISTKIPGFSEFGGHGNFTNPASAEESKIHQQALEGIAQLQDLQTAIDLKQGVTGDKRKVARLEADNANEKAERPIDDRINQMKAQVEVLRAKLQSVGQSDWAKAMIEGAAAGAKAIEEVNKALEKTHKSGQIPVSKQAEIRDLALTEQQIKVDTAYANQLDNITRATRERIGAALSLADAIGKGYEATKKSAVEAELMQKFGREYIGQAERERLAAMPTLAPGTMGPIDAEGEKRKKQAIDETNEAKALSVAHDVDNYKAVANVVDKLGDQVAMENALLAVQDQGAQVIARVTLAMRLEKLAKDQGVEATKEQVALETKLLGITEQRALKTELTDLRRKLATIESITAAEIEGAEAIRKATLDAKYAEMAKEHKYGADTGKVIEATKSEDEAAHQQNILHSAMAVGQALKDQLGVIDEQIAALEKVVAAGKGNEQVQLRIFQLEQEHLKLLVEQALQHAHEFGDLKSGYQAFFTEMSERAKQPGEILYEGLKSGVDKLSTSLSDVMTGQKANWGKMFQELGREQVNSSVKSALQTGLGAIGKVFPQLTAQANAQKHTAAVADQAMKNPSGLNTQDGQSESTAFFVQLAGNLNFSPGTLAPKMPGAAPTPAYPRFGKGETFGSGDMGDFIFSLFKNKKKPGEGGSQEPWEPPTGDVGGLKRLPSGLVDRTGATGPTGNTGDPVHTVQDQSQQSNPLSGGAFGSGGLNLGGIGGILGNFFSSFGGGAAEAGSGAAESVSSAISFGAEVPGFAEGGVTPANQAYMVGENGPELRFDRTPGTIVPMDKIGGSGGDTHIHQYNMPNADLGAAGRLKQMQSMTEQRAVKIATQVIAERAKRTTRGTR